MVRNPQDCERLRTALVLYHRVIDTMSLRPVHQAREQRLRVSAVHAVRLERVIGFRSDVVRPIGHDGPSR